MIQATETEQTDLVRLDQIDIIKLFSDVDAVDPILREIHERVENHVIDVTTAKGRQFCKSLAHNVAKAKTALVKAGKDRTAEMRKTINKVNVVCNKIIADLDKLKVDTRAPLTEWETEQERVKAEEERKAREAAERQERERLATIEALVNARKRELEAIGGPLTYAEDVIEAATEDEWVKMLTDAKDAAQQWKDQEEQDRKNREFFALGEKRAEVLSRQFGEIRGVIELAELQESEFEALVTKRQAKKDEAERIAKEQAVERERIDGWRSQLARFGHDMTFDQLRGVSVDDFQVLLENANVAYDNRIAAQAKAKEEAEAKARQAEKDHREHVIYEASLALQTLMNWSYDEAVEVIKHIETGNVPNVNIKF